MKLTLPDSPGVYFFKDSSGGVLYVGKATSLRDRVRSYFTDELIVARGPRFVDMVVRAHTVSFEEAGSVLEALMREAEEIKRLQPPYNTKEKDDKSYNCLVITKEPFPKVLLVRKKDIDPVRKMAHLAKSRSVHQKIDAMFGPYPHSSRIREALRIVRKIFPYLDAAALHKDKEAFYRQLALAPDTSGPSARAQYQKTIRHLKLLFSGKGKELRRVLARDMHAAARGERFEEATRLRNQLYALEHVRDVALITRDKVEGATSAFRIEGYDVAHLSGKAMVGVMVVLDGERPDKSQYRMFKIRSLSKANDPAALAEILFRRLSHPEWPMPAMVVVDGNEVQRRTAQKILQKFKQPAVVVSVVKDERHRPRALLGPTKLIEKRRLAILLANVEAHRFALSFHKRERARGLLPGRKAGKRSREG